MNNNFLSSPKKIYPSQLVLTSMRIENEIRPLFTPNDIKMEISLTKNNTKYECPICLGPGKNLCFTSKCKHIFCMQCIDKWKRYSQKCPLCRTQVDKLIQFPNYF